MDISMSSTMNMDNLDSIRQAISKMAGRLTPHEMMKMSFGDMLAKICREWMNDRDTEEWGAEDHDQFFSGRQHFALASESCLRGMAETPDEETAMAKFVATVEFHADVERMKIASIAGLIEELIAIGLDLLRGLMESCGRPPSDDQVSQELRMGTRRVRSAMLSGFRKHAKKRKLDRDNVVAVEATSALVHAFMVTSHTEVKLIVRMARRKPQKMGGVQDEHRDQTVTG